MPTRSIAEQLLSGTKLGEWLYGKPQTYTDGYGTERNLPEFKESANGQFVQRVKDSTTDFGKIVVENVADTASDVYSGVKSATEGDWGGVALAATSLILPQAVEGVVKNTQIDEVVKRIRTAIKNSELTGNFKTYGQNTRDLMRKIPGNEGIVDRLTDEELGWLMTQRENVLSNSPKDMRVAIFDGMDGRTNQIHNIKLKKNGKEIGQLHIDYENALPGTVSVGRVENVSHGMEHGISEDLYNALMIATGKPMSAGTRWLMPEKTSKVYRKYKHYIDPTGTTYADWLFDDVLNNPKLSDRAMKISGNDTVEDLKSYLQEQINDGSRTRWGIPQPRIVLTEPTKQISSKHENLFKIFETIGDDGLPTVKWDSPDPFLKRGGKLPPK